MSQLASYIEQVQANKIISEGAAELASKAKAYMDKKEKENKSFESYIKQLDEIAEDEFQDLTPEDLITVVMAADEFNEVISDRTAKEADAAFENLCYAIARVQKVSAQASKEMKAFKAKRDEGKTIPK